MIYRGPELNLLTVVLIVASINTACSQINEEAVPFDQSDRLPTPDKVSTMDISSPAFRETRPRKRIPERNTCFGENISPPLKWSNVPANAKSLAIIVEEPEERIRTLGDYKALASGGFVHWILYNIPISTTNLPEGLPTSTTVLPGGITQGLNSDGGIGYKGPCPPISVVQYGGTTGKGRWSSDPPHEYHFRIYALDTQIEIGPGATNEKLLAAMKNHTLAFGEAVGKYQTPRQQGWYLGDSKTPVINTPIPSP